MVWFREVLRWVISAYQVPYVSTAARQPGESFLGRSMSFIAGNTLGLHSEAWKVSPPVPEANRSRNRINGSVRSSSCKRYLIFSPTPLQGGHPGCLLAGRVRRTVSNGSSTCEAHHFLRTLRSDFEDLLVFRDDQVDERTCTSVTRIVQMARTQNLNAEPLECTLISFD